MPFFDRVAEEVHELKKAKAVSRASLRIVSHACYNNDNNAITSVIRSAINNCTCRHRYICRVRLTLFFILFFFVPRSTVSDILFDVLLRPTVIG